MPDSNPFVGPNPLGNTNPLFGRDREVRELRSMLTSDRILLLYSPSGAGKSSIINAKHGLCDQLRERFDIWSPTRVNKAPTFPVANRYVWSSIAGFEFDRPEELRRVPESLASETLAGYIKTRRDKRPDDVLLVFDQFEEILRVEPLNVQPKRSFFSELGALLKDDTIWVLFVLREDYLAPLDPYVKFLPTRLQHRYRVDLLRREQAQKAMTGIARLGGHEFASDAADHLVIDLALVNAQNESGITTRQTGEFVEPLQMQVVCRNLWERLPPGAGIIEISHVKQCGDVNAALSDYYAMSVAAVARGDRSLEWRIRQWIGEKLITPDGIRNQVVRAVPQTQGLDDPIIRELVDTHLVRSEVRAGAVWYELAHDRLIDPVRASNLAWSERLAEVEKRAVLWSKSRPAGLLLVDHELVDAKVWATENRPLEDLHEFFSACDERQARLDKERLNAFRLRLALRVAAALAVIAVVFAVLARSQKREAQAQTRIATSVRLATAALFHRNNRVDLAALLGIEAWGRAETVDARNALLSSLQANPGLIAVVGSHTSRVDTIAFSPDGEFLASAGHDRILRLWDVATRRERSQMTGHTDTINSIAFSPDGKMLVSGADDKTLRLWAVATWAPIGPPLTAKSGGNVYSVAFSPDGGTIASGHSDGDIWLWDVATRQPRDRLQRGHSDSVRGLAISPDGKMLASSGNDKIFRLWDLATGRSASIEIPEPRFTIRQIAFHRSGGIVALACDDHKVRLWDVVTKKQLGEPLQKKDRHSREVYSVAFSTDGATLASSSSDQTTILWDVSDPLSPKPLHHPYKGHAGIVTSVAFHKDGKMFATAGEDNTIRLWDATTQNSFSVSYVIHDQNVSSVAFSPDSKRIASASWDKSIRLWDVEKREQVGTPLLQHTDVPHSLAFSADGKWLASAGDDRTILWDITSKPPLAHRRHGKSTLLGVGFSAESHVFAAGGAFLQSTLSRLPLLLSIPGKVPPDPPNASSAVAFGVGRRVAEGTVSGNLSIWDGPNRVPLADLPDRAAKPVSGIAFSTDGKRFAAARDGLYIWDFVKNDDPVRLHGPAYEVSSIAFSPGDKMIAAADSGSVYLWEPVTRRPLGDPIPGKNTVAFSPDGRFLATGGENMKVEVWDMKPASWIRRLCRLANRNLSPAEWELFIGADVPYKPTCPPPPSK